MMKGFFPMQKMISTLKNEDGSAIIIAILILVLMTIIGTSATQTTVVELEIVRNDLVHKDQLYRADGAVMQAAQWIQDQPDAVLQDISTDTTDAISIADVNLTDLNLNDNINFWNIWAQADTDPEQAANVLTGYKIVDQTGVIMLNQSQTHTYAIYGLYNRTTGTLRSQGQVLLSAGFRKLVNP
jgi:Tfp pilus assembly protein PilX